ncbi:MAG: hypothetical protein Tsb0016_22420 [Sphingomonadales bacterium]
MLSYYLDIKYPKQNFIDYKNALYLIKRAIEYSNDRKLIGQLLAVSLIFSCNQDDEDFTKDYRSDYFIDTLNAIVEFIGIEQNDLNEKVEILRIISEEINKILKITSDEIKKLDYTDAFHNFEIIELLHEEVEKRIILENGGIGDELDDASGISKSVKEYITVARMLIDGSNIDRFEQSVAEKTRELLSNILIYLENIETALEPIDGFIGAIMEAYNKLSDLTEKQI